MCYFTDKIGLLFHKDYYGCTPFQLTCIQYRKEELSKVIEEVIDGKRFTVESFLSTDFDENMFTN